MPSFCISAGAPRPTFQPSGRSPFAMRSRRVASCFSMPRAMRGSSQGLELACATSDSVDQCHGALRYRMPVGDQRLVTGIVVPSLRGFLVREFDDHHAARLVPFQHLVRATFGEIAPAMLLDERNCI